MQHLEQLGDVVMSNRNAFGHTRGTRGVNQVGDILRRRCRQRRAGMCRNARVLNINDDKAAPIQPIGQPGSW